MPKGSRAARGATLLTFALGAGCAAGSQDPSSHGPGQAEGLANQDDDSQNAALPSLFDDLFGGSDDADAGRPQAPSSWGSGPSELQLPQVNGPCPDFHDGYIELGGATISMTVGNGPGPLVFYWHGTGTTSDEVEIGLPGATLEVKLTGGIVASFEDTSGVGDNTGDLWWYTGDIDIADQIVACGIEAGLVDPARIYSAGYSAGGLQTGTMVFSRSQYLASAVVYSGGPMLGGLIPGSTWFSDPSHIPAVLGAHGAAGSDWLVLDFADGTHMVEDEVTAAGGFAIDCDDGGDHAIAWFLTRAGVNGMAWQFLKDHPYGAAPYDSLPFGFPSYCSLVR